MTAPKRTADGFVYPNRAGCQWLPDGRGSYYLNVFNREGLSDQPILSPPRSSREALWYEHPLGYRMFLRWSHPEWFPAYLKRLAFRMLKDKLAFPASETTGRRHAV